MPLGKNLSELEIGRIEQLLDDGVNVTNIAFKVERSRKCIQTYIKNRGKPKVVKSGRKKILTPQDVRQINKLASNQVITAGAIRKQLDLQCSDSTVLRALEANPNLKYKRMRRCQAMTTEQKKLRVEWCKRHIEEDTQWKRWVFSDEKKFNLDGPDGWAYYWHDTRKPERVFQKRQMGGGSVMVWGCFGIYRRAITFVEGRQKSNDYIRTLEYCLLPRFRTAADDPPMFQQDGASIHRSTVSKDWLNANVGPQSWCQDWPAKSPDLNPIENLWSIMSRKVYEGCKQYKNVQELKTAIGVAWKAIPDETITKLLDSLPSRCQDVIDYKGEGLHY